MKTTTATEALQIDPGDNVLVALHDLAAGQRISGVVLVDNIPAGHKFARRRLNEGESVIKYGYTIGRTSQAIPAGTHVHGHNLESALPETLEKIQFADLTKTRALSASTRPPPALGFEGFRRHGGGVGIRNEIWVINTVGCVNQAAERIARRAHAELASHGSGIDGVYSFSHPFGCSQLGDDFSATRDVLAGLVNHPNAAAVLVLGLGCENNQLALFLEAVGPQPAGRIRFFNAQDVPDEVTAGMEAVRELAKYARQFRREWVPSSELILGMKCGGSDGFSGITANPLVGWVADRAAAAGGTVLLSEVPEMFGAERVLLERAADERAFQGVVSLVTEFRSYFQKHHEPIDENPSPGNKAGGITTLAEKSLGCVQKGGKALIRETLAYGQRARPGLGGLALVNAPGNDGVSGTAMTVAGAHLILFTTGRGNPLGYPVPTLKISSNTGLAQRKPQWIDLNAGSLADGTSSPEALTEQLWQRVLDVASGQTQAQNEINGCREIAIWKDGVTL